MAYSTTLEAVMLWSWLILVIPRVLWPEFFFLILTGLYYDVERKRFTKEKYFCVVGSNK